jgi:hypothetical protein
MHKSSGFKGDGVHFIVKKALLIWQAWAGVAVIFALF